MSITQHAIGILLEVCHPDDKRFHKSLSAKTEAAEIVHLVDELLQIIRRTQWRRNQDK
jgi:hypothetical protein